MSDVTPDLVRHLANLARIELDEAEVVRFTEQLGVILDSVAKISSAIDENTPATSHQFLWQMSLGKTKLSLL